MYLCLFNYCFWFFFPNVIDLSTDFSSTTYSELKDRSKILNIFSLLLRVYDLTMHWNRLIVRLIFLHRYHSSVYSLPVLFALWRFISAPVHECETRATGVVSRFFARTIGGAPIECTITTKENNGYSPSTCIAQTPPLPSMRLGLLRSPYILSIYIYVTLYCNIYIYYIYLYIWLVGYWAHVVFAPEPRRAQR